MEIYEISIGGVPHTVQLDKETAERLKAKPHKPKAPAKGSAKGSAKPQSIKDEVKAALDEAKNKAD